MVEINLLPWRAWQQQYEKQCMLIGALLLFLVLVFQYLLLHLWLNGWSSEAEQHLTALIQEKEQLLTQKQFSVPAFPLHAGSVLELYQRQTVALWQVDENKKWLPLCVNSIDRQKQRIVIEGEVESANDLSAFLQTWSTAKQFSQLQVQQLQQIPQQERLHFQVVGMEATDIWSEQSHESSV